MTAEGADANIFKTDQNTEYLEVLVCTRYKKLNLRSWSAESATAPFSNPLAEQFLLSQGQVCRMRAPVPHLSMPKWIWQPISKSQSLKEHKEEECALSAPHKTTGKKQALWKVVLAILVSKWNSRSFLLLETMLTEMVQFFLQLKQCLCLLGMECKGPFSS